jgi:hypothetical protein
MTVPPTDAVEPTEGGVPTAGVQPPADVQPPVGPRRPTRRPPVERVAAILIAAVFLLPAINAVLWVQAGPVEGCMEACGVDEGAARVSLGLGIVGLLLAAAIWRRHLSAQAIGLFMCVTVVAVLGIILAGAVLTSDPVAALGPAGFGLAAGIFGAFAVAGLFLAAAVMQRIQEA